MNFKRKNYRNFKPSLSNWISVIAVVFTLARKTSSCVGLKPAALMRSIESKKLRNQYEVENQINVEYGRKFQNFSKLLGNLKINRKHQK